MTGNKKNGYDLTNNLDTSSQILDPGRLKLRQLLLISCIDIKIASLDRIFPALMLFIMHKSDMGEVITLLYPGYETGTVVNSFFKKIT